MQIVEKRVEKTSGGRRGEAIDESKAVGVLLVATHLRPVHSQSPCHEQKGRSPQRN